MMIRKEEKITIYYKNINELKKKKKGSNGGSEEQKHLRHTKNKQLNGRSPSLSVITLNVNGLNVPINRQELT